MSHTSDQITKAIFDNLTTDITSLIDKLSILGHKINCHLDEGDFVLMIPGVEKRYSANQQHNADLSVLKSDLEILFAEEKQSA